jgi:hypothetical protein
MSNLSTYNFILDHSTDDVRTLALQATRYPEVDMPFAVKQIAGRQRIRTKVPSFYSLPEILYPAQLSLEQCSSEVTAVYKASLLTGTSFADLTGGFGIDCYFISRNFQKAFYIEKNKELLECVRHNYQTLKAGHVTLECTNAESFLEQLDNKLNAIYLDPARRDLKGNKLVLITDCEPDVASLTPLLKEKCNKLMIKLSPMLDISRALQDLPAMNEVHVVSVDNECKEILLITDWTRKEDILYKTVNFRKDNEEHFSFYLAEEASAGVRYASHVLKYLYEPNSSLMKAGAFRILSERFELLKLHANTHLYTSDELIRDFPGRVFKVESVTNSSRQSLKSLKTNAAKANITVRNYPATVDEIRKKTGIKEGGDQYIFACKCAEDHLLIKATKAV